MRDENPPLAPSGEGSIEPSLYSLNEERTRDLGNRREIDSIPRRRSLRVANSRNLSCRSELRMTTNSAFLWFATVREQPVYWSGERFGSLSGQATLSPSRHAFESPRSSLRVPSSRLRLSLCPRLLVHVHSVIAFFPVHSFLRKHTQSRFFVLFTARGCLLPCLVPRQHPRFPVSTLAPSLASLAWPLPLIVADVIIADVIIADVIERQIER